MDLHHTTEKESGSKMTSNKRITSNTSSKIQTMKESITQSVYVGSGLYQSTMLAKRHYLFIYLCNF